MLGEQVSPSASRRRFDFSRLAGRIARGVMVGACGMCLLGASQPANADFTAITGTRTVTLAQDGTCTPNVPRTDFNVDVTITTNGAARIYFIAGDGFIMETVNIGTIVAPGQDLSGFPIPTANTPTTAPFSVIFSQDTVSQGNGNIYQNTNGEFERVTFDPSLFDPDCPGLTTGPTAQDKSNTVAALQGTFNSAMPSLLDNLPANGGNGQGNGVTLAPTGLGFSQSRIDSNNPLDRDYGAAFADRGYFDGGQKRRRGNGFNFSVDMNQLANTAANDNETGSLAYGTGSKDASIQPRSRITSFIKGEYVDFDDGETNADRDGHLWVVTSGLGLRVSPSTTVGILSRYRSGEADSSALSAELDSDFWGGGAFLTTTIGGGLNVALAGLYETGDNDIRIGTATGSFDSEHVTLEGRIDKRFERGTFWIEPGVGIRYIDTDQDNYTDSAGTLVTNQDLTLGRLTYGPTVGTTIVRGNAMLKPFAKINGLWDFENDGNFATSTAGTFTSADSAINLGGGIEVVYASGLSLKLAGDWYGYNTDLEVWSLSGGIGAPLSALGLGQVGLVSLDLASNAEDASATARLRIPLGGAK